MEEERRSLDTSSGVTGKNFEIGLHVNGQSVYGCNFMSYQVCECISSIKSVKCNRLGDSINAKVHITHGLL